MRYERFLRGNLDGFCTLNGLSVADLGFYEDRRIWLCYHAQESAQTRIAIEQVRAMEGTTYDIISELDIANIIVQTNEEYNIAWVQNIEEIKPIGIKIAKFIYDMDNNRIHQ